MRLTAMRVPISDIMSGQFLKQPGEWGSSFVLTGLGLCVSRTSVIARVLQKFEGEAGNYGSLTLDDTTGTLRARFFDDTLVLMKDVSVGDLVDVIGKVREYNSERHIVAESVVVLDDDNWSLLRKAEIAQLHRDARRWKQLYERKRMEKSGDDLRMALLSSEVPEWYIDALMDSENSAAPVREEITEAEVVEEEAAVKVPEGTDAGAKDKILAIIRGSDTITYTDIIKQSGFESDVVDSVLEQLTDEGEIFEPRSGKFKKL